MSTIPPIEILLREVIQDIPTHINTAHITSDFLNNIPLPSKTRIDKVQLHKCLLPTNIDINRYEIWRYILTCNNHQPTWNSRNAWCEHCGSNCDKSNMHQLFECEKFAYERSVILEALTEYIQEINCIENSQLYAYLTSTTTDRESLSIDDQRTFIEYMINPNTDDIFEEHEHIAVIRTYLVLLYASQVYQIKKYNPYL